MALSVKDTIVMLRIVKFSNVTRSAFLAGSVCLLGAGSVLLHASPPQQAARVIESIDALDVHNTFAADGALQKETRPARIFAVRKGDPDGIVKSFDAAKGDKLRLGGFGLTKPEAVKALMQQTGRDAVLQLPGGPSITLLNLTVASLPDSCFQLELDRAALVQTFGDDFDRFSWYSEGLSAPEDKSGVWRTNYGLGLPGSEGSRSMPGQSQVYADKAFRGEGAAPLGLDPFHIANGILEIRAEPAPERVLPFIWGRKYISGLITSKYSFSQRYGVFEIRARLPKGQGFWPAFWLLPADGSWPPEIDVFEVLGHDTKKLYASAHSQAAGAHTATGGAIPVSDVSDDFHQYAVDWQEDEIRWYLDGVEIARTRTPADMHNPMYLLANLGVGGDWPGEPDSRTQFPGVFAIDYIRAYQRATAAASQQ